MLPNITTTCFAASYAMALALEASRLWFRTSLRGWLTLGFATAGLFAQTLFLYYRAVTATGTPLSSSYEWFLLAAWILAAVYLYLTCFHPQTAIGLFVLPLVLALIGAAQFADPQPFARDPAVQVWGAIHGAFQLLVLVAVTFGFAAGLMYLAQARRLKLKLPPAQGFRLPSLEWLAHANARAVVVAALMAGAGFVTGAILNLVNHHHERESFSWNDSVVWRSAFMLAWFVAAAVFSVLYKPARQGRKVAYLTLANFVLLAISLVIGLVLPSEHGGRTAVEHPAPREARP